MLSNSKIHLIAAREARRKHIELRIDCSKQINIFEIIESCKIPLMFQPLKKLSGAFIPAKANEDNAAGILINELHPRSRQRYTAAHEFCHYIRDGYISLDIDTEIISRTTFDKINDMERIAEAFAAWFLMPKELIEATSKSIGLQLNNIEAEGIYQLSLCMGTSYSATVHHLYTLRFIDKNNLEKLLNKSPKTIKSVICDTNIGWNDIWVINENMHNTTILPQVGDHIAITLNELPSTGYLWHLSSLTSNIIEIRKNTFSLTNNNNYLISSPGKREISLLVREEGTQIISLLNYRPWLDENNSENFSITAMVEGKRHGINLQAYLN